MLSVKLSLPPFYTESQISQLGENVETVAFIATRADNRDDGPWRVEWLVSTMGEVDALKDAVLLNAARYEIDFPSSLTFVAEDVPDRDWLAESYQQFPAFEIAPFFIYGSHHTGVVPDGLLGLQIDAATAFGSGEHGTTKGCLLAMEWLKEQGVCPWNILDMGTGSGILAIAAWKLWKTPVLAVDNDEEAVRVADNHRVLNVVPDELRCAHGDGFAASIVDQKAPYELIIANILAGPLKDMAGDLAAVCDDNSYVILSGILNSQAESVITVYAAQGLVLKQHTQHDEWSTLVLHKR